MMIYQTIFIQEVSPELTYLSHDKIADLNPSKPGNSSIISIPIVVGTSINIEFGYDIIIG